MERPTAIATMSGGSVATGLHNAFAHLRESSRLHATCYYQQQHNQEHQAETSTTVVACTIERSAAPISKTAEKGDDQNDQKDCAKCHESSFQGMTLKQTPLLEFCSDS